MKNLIYTLTLILLFISCKSINTLIEQGRYDEALEYSAKQLIGKKNKKTKYVKALEKAYAELNNKDLKQIKMLSSNPKQKSYDQIVSIYKNMNKRQEFISPLIPLISKDGYVANFKTRNYITLISGAIITAADNHYVSAQRYLINAREGNKAAARNAFNRLQSINNYYDNYKETNILTEEAYELGQTNILIEHYTQGNNLLQNMFLKSLIILILKN